MNSNSGSYFVYGGRYTCSISCHLQYLAVLSVRTGLVNPAGCKLGAPWTVDIQEVMLSVSERNAGIGVVPLNAFKDISYMRFTSVYMRCYLVDARNLNITVHLCLPVKADCNHLS